MLYCEEFGRVKGHFGPVNALAIAHDGSSYCSGAEDGYATRCNLFLSSLLVTNANQNSPHFFVFPFYLSALFCALSAMFGFTISTKTTSI